MGPAFFIMHEIKTARRSQAKIRLGLQGPSGSGKTYSALLMAYGLCGEWRKIVVVDSEHNSSHLYAHLGPYNVLGIGQPYSPESYIEAIRLCEKAGMEVIILDSISHEWDGNGGILDIHSAMQGNSFTNWSKVTPRHNAFVQKILQSPAHVLATIRSKQDYVLSEKNGKVVPEKVGLKGVTRDGMDYEFTVVLDIDLKHQCSASKDRTGLFMDKPSFTITPETGELIKQWCNTDSSLDEVKKAIDQAETIAQLKAIHAQYPNYRDEIRESLIIRKAELEELSVPLNNSQL